ncbi:laccase domain-containing protein, partial [Parasynechococcus sp.]|uniref:laccase domain-containing protein n=1 Tax=Parasynechococcus sp. TaxID=3101203 RepID=UPI00370388B1
AGILITALDRLVERGARREDLVVALGPAVSGPCYQVGDEVVEAVSAAITNEASLSEAGALLPDEQQGRHRLDIRTAARVQLQGAGIPSERIAHCPLCTVSEPELFHSWRRDHVKAVQWSGIVAQAPHLS